MSKYQEYQAEIARLTQLAEEARKGEVNAAKEQIHGIMKQYGLTLADLGTTKQKKERAPVDVKYRNGETGETWTGRGRAPLWLAGKNRDDFLISQ